MVWHFRCESVAGWAIALEPMPTTLQVSSARTQMRTMRMMTASKRWLGYC
jgi:hypothetical protein